MATLLAQKRALRWRKSVRWEERMETGYCSDFSSWDVEFGRGGEDWGGEQREVAGSQSPVWRILWN